MEEEEWVEEEMSKGIDADDCESAFSSSLFALRVLDAASVQIDEDTAATVAAAAASSLSRVASFC